MSSKPIKPDPTDAKTLALYFLEMTGGELARATIQRTIVQVKGVLSRGYSADDVKKVIDHLLSRKSIYSFGYVSSAIDDVIREIRIVEEEQELKREAEIAREQMEASNAERRGKVDECDESSERNRNKAGRFGVQSRLRKKFDFDMFEGQ